MKKLLTILFLFASSVCFAQHQWNTYVTASGTDTYAVTVSVPTITNYTTKRINLRFANANTGASTLNVTPSGASALGAIAIRAWDGDSWEALAGGEIVTGQDYVLVYNGTYFELYPSVVSGEFVYSIQTISGTTHTINAAAIGELNKWFIYTDASGCTVTVGDDVGIGKSVVGQRGPAAGTVTFVDNGTSVLISSSGDFDLEAVNRKASLTKQTSTDWDVTGELGPASGTTLTDGEGTTANGSAVDLGGVISANLLFTGSGNWTWGSNGTPYSGFLNFKGLYTAGAGGINFEVRDASNRYSVFNQSGEDFTMAVRDPTSGFERTSLTMHGSTASIDLIANTALLLGTFSDSYHLSFTEGSGVSLKLGSDAAGDLYRRGSSGFLERIPGGSNTNVLTMVAGMPAWAAPAGGGDALTSNPLSQFATTTSAQLRGVISDEVGTGALVFESGAPTLTGTNFTGIPYGALTGTAPFWALASGGAQTADNTISGAFKTSFTTNSVGIGNSGTHAARLDVQGSGSTSATNALNVGSAFDSGIFTVRDDGVITAGATATSVATSTYKIRFTEPFAFTQSSSIFQAFNGASHYFGTSAVTRITAANNGAASATGTGLLIESNGNLLRYDFRTGSYSSAVTQHQFVGSVTPSTSGVTATGVKITTGMDNSTSPQSSTSFIGLDYDPALSGTITHYAALFRSGKIGAGTATPTATIHIGTAGTTTAGSGPIKLTEGSNPTSAEDGLINYVSNNITFTESSTVYTLAKTLTNTATLDFDLTSVNSQDLTITVTGAAAGDAVSCGVDSGSATANVIFTWWVSGADTVTIRASRIDVASGANPASGTFRAAVIHY